MDFCLVALNALRGHGGIIGYYLISNIYLIAQNNEL